MESFYNISDILKNTFNSLIGQFVDFVPRLIGCIVVLLIGYLVANFVRAIVKNVLGRVGFDKIGERLNQIGFIKQIKAEIKLSNIVAASLYYFIILMFLTAATEILGVETITSMVLSVVNFIPQLIAGAIMLQLGIIISDIIKSAVVTLCKSFNVPSAKLIGNLVFGFFLVITFISALAQIGINTELLESSFIIVFGGIVAAFGVGYGLASRDVLGNIISSFYSKNKYTIGQLIQIDGVKGRIIELDNLSVTIKTEESRVVLPLKYFQSQKVEIFAS
ncbi:hypothetical protein GCM10023091_40310 [Ravibacter arvi]|uniref:Mechanosensitive ion channel MscS domain-containing protein n=1 Tax=Ravibacter arvi TaxID=2051041 RepID=A0ABP8MD59_9BACT